MPEPSISNHFALTALQEGVSLTGSLRVAGALSQNYNVVTHNAIPDWKNTPSARPTIYPVVRKGASYIPNSAFSSRHWYYNEVEILFDANGRSTNYLLAEYRAYLPSGLVLKATGRAGIGWYDDEYTQDVFSRFLGYADLGVGYRSKDGKWELSVDATPVFAPFNVNVNAAAAFHLGAISLFAQFNYGYGEALYDWVRGYRPPPYLRIGLLYGQLL